VRVHHQPLESRYDDLIGLTHYACRIAKILGFSALESTETADNPLEEFLAALPSAQRERLNINVQDLQILIASRVNALEA
jgi:hypothetical protein